MDGTAADAAMLGHMRRRITTQGRCALLLILMVCALAARGGAQIGSLAPTILQSMVMPCAVADHCAGSAAGGAEAGSVIAPTRSSGAASGLLEPTGEGTGSTLYAADPRVSTLVRATFVRSLERRLNGAAAEAIARDLEKHDAVDRWAAMVASQGLRRGDLADALASYWVLNWAMANGGDSSLEALQAVRAQVRAQVATRPALRRLTDAQKQAVAEEAMLNFVYEIAGYMQAREANNGSMLRRFADGAEMRFRNEMRIDLRSLALTDRGLKAKARIRP